MKTSMIDRLMDMSQSYADEIAGFWYNAAVANARSQSIKTISKTVCNRFAAFFLKSLSEMYFSENAFQTVERILEESSIIEVFYARDIPIEEALYSLVLLRRHIWLHADSQALFSSGEDMYNALDSINRVLLVFDYANFIVARDYRMLTLRGKRASIK